MSALPTGVYNFTWSGGTFEVQLRARNIFWCPQFPADARWAFSAESQALEIDWGKYGQYVLKVQGSELVGGARGNESDWRKASFKRAFTPQEELISGSAWMLHFENGVPFRSVPVTRTRKPNPSPNAKPSPSPSPSPDPYPNPNQGRAAGRWPLPLRGQLTLTLTLTLALSLALTLTLTLTLTLALALALTLTLTLALTLTLTLTLALALALTLSRSRAWRRLVCPPRCASSSSGSSSRRGPSTLTRTPNP